MIVLLDLLILVISGLSIFFAYKKGLIRTLFSLVGFIAAVALAFSFCEPVAAWVDSQFIKPAVQEIVLDAINGGKVEGDYDEALSQVDVVVTLREMPEPLENFLENINVDINKLIEGAEKAEADSLTAKERLVESIVVPVSAAISKTVTLIVLIAVFLALLYVITRLLDAVFKVLPVAKSINKIGGIICGLVRAGVLSLIVSAAIYGLACGNILFNIAQLEDTYLIKWINDVNPILSLFQ